MVEVIFIHDDSVKKWDVVIKGAENETEAQQAFNAVVLTCREPITISLEHRVKRIGQDSFKLIPAY